MKEARGKSGSATIFPEAIPAHGGEEHQRGITFRTGRTEGVAQRLAKVPGDEAVPLVVDKQELQRGAPLAKSGVL